MGRDHDSDDDDDDDDDDAADGQVDSGGNDAAVLPIDELSQSSSSISNYLFYCDE